MRIVAAQNDAATAAGPGRFGAIQAVAPSLRMELRPIDVRDDSAEIERAITAFAKGADGGLIVTGSSAAAIHRELIIKLAAKHQLPAVYNSRFYVTSGGLISYGPNFVDQYRSAAVYVDAILRGAKPADLPVQASTKYELVINMKTASSDGNRLKFFRVELNVFALSDFVAFDDIGLLDLIACLGVHIPVADAIACLFIELMETDFFSLRSRRKKRNGARNKRELSNTHEGPWGTPCRGRPDSTKLGSSVPRRNQSGAFWLCSKGASS